MMLMKRKWEIPGENAGQMETKQRGSSRLGNRTCRGLGMGSSSGHVGNCEQFWTPGADNVCIGSRTGWWDLDCQMPKLTCNS